MTMPRLDELARSARSELTRAADERAASRPDLAVLGRRGTRRHTANLLVVVLLVVVGATGVLRLVADEVDVPVIGDVEPTPSEVDETTDDRPPGPIARSGGPVTLEFDSGGPEPHTLHLRIDDDGDLCRGFAGGTGASAINDPDGSCGNPAPDRAEWRGLSGSRSTQVAGSAGEVQSCESGAVAGNVATVELHFPDGHVLTSEVLAAPEIGDVSWYLTCWEGDHDLSTLVLFDEHGDELERSDYIQR